MRPLYVESRKSFDHGFVLNEEELRRFVGVLREQHRKVNHSDKETVSFEVRFLNGAVSRGQSLDDVLKLENAGSARITSVSIEVKNVSDDDTKGEEPPSVIKLTFSDPDVTGDYGCRPIHYYVMGEDRDWVFVTSSLLQERIEKIKRLSWLQIRGRSFRLIFLRLWFPMVLLLFLFVSVFAMTRGAAKLYQSDQAPHAQLQRFVEDNNVTNVITVILKDREIADQMMDGSLIVKTLPLSLLGVIVALSFLPPILAFAFRLYPSFNFCWGDYVAQFDKLEGRRKFWLIVVGLGVVVSMVGGILANKF